MAGVWTDTVAGPASYAAGGFVVTTGLASVLGADVVVATPGAVLAPFEAVVARNTPAAGQLTVKLMRRRFDKLTALGAISGLPAGVSAAAASGQAVDADTAHTHAGSHDHAAVTSGNVNADGGGVALNAVGPNISSHTHSFDAPNGGSSVDAGTSHDHTISTLYQHQHAVTNTATDLASSEVPAATNLSGATFTVLAVG